MISSRTFLLAGVIAQMVVAQSWLYVSPSNVPDDIDFCLASVARQRNLKGPVSPYYLRGDFDGDGATDYAALVSDDKMQRGIAVCRSGIGKPVVIGAGVPFEGAVHVSFDAWAVWGEGSVPGGGAAGEPLVLEGDGILILRTEEFSGLIYWEGGGFRYTEICDVRPLGLDEAVVERVKPKSAESCR